MQFVRRRKNGHNGAGAAELASPSPMNNFFGTVGSPIKMSTFDRHMELRDRRKDDKQPSPVKATGATGGTGAAGAKAGAVDGAAAARHHHRPHHRRRHSIEGLPTRSPSPAPAAPAGAKGSPTKPAPGPAPAQAKAAKARKPTQRRASLDAGDATHVSVNADAVTLDVKKKLVLHKEIQRHQRQQREQAALAPPKPAPKNDILSVHDNSSEDSEDDGKDKDQDIATVKNQGRGGGRGSTEFMGSTAVEPVQQLKLDGARKAKIPHFMSAWFNAEPAAKEKEKENKNVAAAPAAPAPPVAAALAQAPPPAPAAAAAVDQAKQQQPTAAANNNTKLNGRGYSQNINFSEITCGRMIGEGAFGKVYEGKWRGKGVAVKVLVCQDLRSDILHEFQSEVEIMSVLRHPNICRLLGACMDPPHRALVVELMQRGSLWGVLRTHRKTLDLEKRTRFVYDTAKGMAYLHHFERPILHRDLKSPNLLVDKNYNIKLADFGLARVKAHVQTMTGNCGTVQWMAPEVLGNQKYTEKADVFSFGIVIWEIMTGECPYDGMSQIQAALGVLNRNLRPNIPKDCPPFFSRLMKACWNRQPELRPSFPHIVSAFRTYQTSISETRATSSAAASANAAVAASIATP